MPRKPGKASARGPARRPADAVGEDLLRAVAESSADAIALIDGEGKVLYSSPAVKRLLGYEPSERKGRYALDIVHPEDLARAQALFAQLLQQPGTAITTDVRCRDRAGSYHTLEVVGINRLADAAVGAVVVTYRDVTERRVLEEHVQASEARLAERELLLRTVIEASPECMKLVAPDGRLLEMNQAGLAMLEADSFEEVRGKVVYDLVVPQHRAAFRDLAARVFRGESGTLEFEIVGLKGGRRWLETHAVPIYQPGKHRPDMLGITRDIGDRKRSEEALRESERRFQLVAQVTNDVICDWDLTADHVWWSEGVHTVFGYEAAQVPVTSAWAFEQIHPDERARVGATLTAAIESGAPSLTDEFRFRRADGSYAHVFDRTFIVRDGAGKAVRLICAMMDVTARRQAEQALREREDLYRALFENAPIGLGIADAQGNLLAFNDAIRKPGGWSVDDIQRIGNVAKLYWDPEDRAQILATARKQGFLFRQEVRYRRKDRGYYDALMSLTPVEIGGKECWLAVVEDVTERKRAEEALRQAEERYRAFIAHSTDGVWRTELTQPMPVDLSEDEQLAHWYRHAYIAECNDAMARMCGYASSSELVGKQPADALVRSDSRSRDFYLGFFRAGYRLADVESHERDREGRPKVFLINLVGIVENGQVLRAWGMQRDVTDKKRLEEQLRQAQKMEAIGRLAGGVAHDFNNLLTAMLGSAEMLLAGLGPSDPRVEDATDIKVAASRAAALTRQLLAFGRRQVLKPQPLDLNRVVNDVQRLLRRLIPEDIELVTRPAPGLRLVLADRGQLEQVLVNLVVNARDAMRDGGVMMIETANADLDEAFARRNPGSTPGPHVALTVRDTGLGMDAETKAHIFEPFFTTKEVGKGTGLGLATVYGIVKQSGGYITVESEPKVGTAFVIYLPLAPEGEWPGEPEPSRDESGAEVPARRRTDLRGGTETILVAEDEERIRVSSKRILEYFGYRVLLAADGAAALEVLDAAQPPVDLVVSDVVMPRMNGQELYDAVHSKGKPTKFLFTSGYVGREGHADPVLAPGVPFLPKPWTMEDLVERVRDVLDGKRGA